MSLDRPLTLPCGLELRDRVGLAPLTNLQSHADGTLSDDEYQWLIRRAADGFGWVSTCAAYVSEEAKAWVGQLGIAHDSHLEGLTRLATGIRAHGSVGIVQLHHAGYRATVAENRLSTGGPDGAREATEADLDQVVADYVAAAERAEKAGFDGVEIHGANGYLFTQFLAPLDNPRTDRWGGSLENRARLLRDTLRAVRAAVSPSFAVGVRISPVDTWERRGLTIEDSAQLVQWLAEDGTDFVHLSLRDASGPAPFGPDDGPSVARAIRDVLPASIPLLAAGDIWTLDDATRALEAGVDMVILGRSAIANPDWPRRCADPGWQPVRPPWTRAHLASVDVSQTLIDYLARFRGPLVEPLAD